VGGGTARGIRRSLSAAVAATNLEEAEESAWSEIDSDLGEMAPYDFQQLVAGLLVAMGYYVEWISPPGADGGFDVIAHTDPLDVKVRGSKSW
jgi:restriction system protein